MSGNLLAVCLILLLFPATGFAGTSMWELTFGYRGSELSLSAAARVPPTKKRFAEPNLDSFPVVVYYNLDWLDADGGTLLSTQVSFPLGDWYDDFTNRTGGVTIPSEGCLPVRLPGPVLGMEPCRIRLRRAGAEWNQKAVRSEGVPDAFRFEEIALDIQDGFRKTEVEPGPIGITKVHDSGDDDNRIVIVILGDGYTEQNLADGVFERDVERLLEAYQSSPPWNDYLQTVSIYRIDVVSREEGIDLVDSGVFVDTYFDANLSGRRLRMHDLRVSNVVFQYLPPFWPESILVLCNSPVRCGSAGDRIGRSYNGETMEGVALHEQGHQFGDLADEYESGAEVLSEKTYQENWDTTFERNRLKWRVWVEPDTPLPTPETLEFVNVVGAFEGAARWPNDVYRPWLDCMMRDLSPFCPVCQEVLSTSIISPLELAGSANPDVGTTIVVDSSPVTVTVTPLRVSPLAFEWKLAGLAIADATGPSLTLTADALGGEETAELSLTISHPTPRIRKRRLFDEYVWTLKRELTTSVPNWQKYE